MGQLTRWSQGLGMTAADVEHFLNEEEHKRFLVVHLLTSCLVYLFISTL
jgi:hypothetical protein